MIRQGLLPRRPSTPTPEMRRVLHFVLCVTAAFVRVREDRCPSTLMSWNPSDPEAGTPRSAMTTTRVRLPPRRRLPRLLRLRMNDYFGYFDYNDYFDYDPKTMASESEDPSIRCVTPTLNPIYHICVFYLKSCIIN